MSIKLKVLGLGLLATLAMSAVAVMNASAEEGGHFVSEGNKHVLVTGFAGPETLHNLHLLNVGLEGEIGCKTQVYHATTEAETTTSITVTPTYSECLTTPNGSATPVDVNGCTYTFTVAPITTPEPEGGNKVEQTIHLLCPEGKKIEITHPNCTVSVHPQTIKPTEETPTTVTYTTATNEKGVHEITMDVDVKFTATRHGLCQFVTPTTGKGRLFGSVTIQGFDTLGNQVPITAT